jgi:hypothetical protein
MQALSTKKLFRTDLSPTNEVHMTSRAGKSFLLNVKMKSATTPVSAPDDATLQGLAGAWIAIRSANKAIELQGSVPTISVPGLEGVNDSLTTAKANATTWTQTTSADVQNTLQHIIDYNTLYAALASSINSAISQIKNATTTNPPPSDTMSNLAAELGALQSQVQAVLYGAGGSSTSPVSGSALATYNEMVAYQGKVSTDASTFSGYQTLAYNSKTGISAQIKEYNDDITADRDAMAKDRAMIAGGAAMIVTGVLICVVAVALAPETGGATVAAIGTLGVATIAGGAVMIGVSSHDLESKESDVSNKLIAIANDQTELADLTTIGTASGDVSQHADTIYGALDTIFASWQQMDNAMGDVITALGLPQAELLKWIQDKSGQNPTYFIMGTILEAQFASPQADWAKAATTAQTLLTSMSNVVEFTLPTGTVPTPNVIAQASVGKQAA